MPAYSHGGDIWDKGGELADFSANLSPIGAPEEVLEAAARAAREELGRYPDALCTALRQAIAGADGVAAEQVICGNGAADLIFRLCQTLRPRRALITAPTFSEYGAALRAAGCETAEYVLPGERRFDLDEGVLDAIAPETDLVFLCTPNNPTGRLIPPELLRAAAERCRECGALLAVDECFVPLSDHPEWGMAREMEQYPNLFLLRAFTKSYAIPGVRLGYGLCGDGALLERLYDSAQPWSVSAVAQAAGIAACGRRDWPERGREVIQRERPALKAALEELGLQVWPGEANFLLFRAGGIIDLKERLLERGVLIRSCGNYRGLAPDHYRVCVKTGGENAVLLRALREVL